MATRYKVGRMAYEGSGTDMQTVAQPVKANFEAFAAETGRELMCEIEPGTFMVANACSVVSTVQDMVSTKKNCSEGQDFLKTDSGMTDVLRCVGRRWPGPRLAGRLSDAHLTPDC
eukprot:COSAG01_NODE_22453_length_855_cov_0.801587_1_plen_115_part_00